MKSVLKGAHFSSVEEIKAASNTTTQGPEKKGLHGVLSRDGRNDIIKCIDSEGDYFEGEN